MESMFVYAQNFNQPLNSWTVNNVTSMDAMFTYATNYNQNLGGWVVNPKVTTCTDFSTGATAWVLSKPSFSSCTP